MTKLITKTIMRGDTPTFTFTITQDGSAYDLTGATAYFAAKTSVSATGYLFNVLCILAAEPATGICTATLTALQTATAGTYIAELEIQKGGVILTPIQFTLRIQEDVRV